MTKKCCMRLTKNTTYSFSTVETHEEKLNDRFQVLEISLLKHHFLLLSLLVEKKLMELTALKL